MSKPFPDHEQISAIVSSGKIVIFQDAPDYVEMIVMAGPEAAAIKSIVAHARTSDEAKRSAEIAHEIEQRVGSPKNLSDALDIAMRVAERSISDSN